MATSAAIYPQMPDQELDDIACDRAALLGCEFDVSRTANGYLAAFERDDPVAGRAVLFSAEAHDRRTAVISLLRQYDLERQER
jgi:hypothetical protein